MSVTHTSSLNIGQSIVPEDVPELEFFPNSANLYPKFSDKIKNTAVEVWLFDAVSQDGTDAFTVSFLRDSIAAPRGFRVGINASWDDGTSWGSQLFLPNSKITQEGESLEHGHIQGVWSSANSHASFDISEDLSRATVSFDAAGQISGTLNLQSLAYPSLPQTADAAKASPDVFWVQPIAMADATLDVTITTEKGAKKMLISSNSGGYGGINRSWQSTPFTKSIGSSVFVRAQVGPYVLQIMRLVGPAEKNHALTGNAKLYRHGKLVCVPERIAKDLNEAVGGKGDSLILTKVYDKGGVAATLRDTNTGYIIDFVSGQGQRWRFDVQHHRIWWEKYLGPPGPNSPANSGFIGSITGGLAEQSEAVQGWGILLLFFGPAAASVGP